MVNRTQASSKRTGYSSRKSPPVWALLLLLVLLASAGAWFLRSRQSQLTDAQDPRQLTQQQDGTRVKDYRHRSRDIEAELTDEEYLEKMVSRDKKAITNRLADVREMRDQLKLKHRRNLYADRKSELRSLIAKHGQKRNDKNPRSIVNDAIRQLGELEEDAPY